MNTPNRHQRRDRVVDPDAEAPDGKSISRRRFLSGSAGLLALPTLPALLAACGKGSTAKPLASAQKLTIALNGFENNLTPFTITFLALPNTNDLVHLVHDSLFWSQASQSPEPFLAESASPNADRTMWTVKVRPGVLWHDGQPFTADDVKFSFEYYVKNGGSSGRYAHHASDVPPFDHAEIVDPQTVRLFFKAAAPTFQILPGADLPMIPRHVWEAVTDPKKYSTQLPVGTGPYKLTQIVPDQLYRFTANDRYFKGKPLVTDISMPIVTDPSAAFTSLRTGQVDFVSRNVPPELVDQFSKTSGLKVVKGTKFESIQLYFNAAKPPLKDAKLRKAISLAIDSNALVRTVLLGRGRPGNDGFLHPDSPWVAPGGSHQFDVNGAQQMLETAGYTQKDSDGVRKAPGGRRLEFAVLVSSFDPQSLRAVQLVAQQVATIGVKLNPTPLDPAALTQARAARDTPYDAYVSGLETHAHADPDGLYYFFHSPGTKGFGAGVTGYSNLTFDALSEMAATTFDLNARKQLLYQMQGILAQEAPVVVFYYPDGIYGYRPAAYGGWISDPGQGIFTKRSFLPNYSRPST